MKGAEGRGIAAWLGYKKTAGTRAYECIKQIREEENLRVIAPEGEMGGDILAAANIPYEKIRTGRLADREIIGEKAPEEREVTTREDTLRYAKLLEDQGIDLLVFCGGGEIKDFTATYSEYVAWKREYEAARHAQEVQARPKPQAVRTQAAETAPRKLSYNEKRELEMLEREIPVLEAEKAALEESLSSGSLGVDELTAQSQRIAELIGLIDEKTMRWLLLSER